VARAVERTRPARLGQPVTSATYSSALLDCPDWKRAVQWRRCPSPAKLAAYRYLVYLHEMARAARTAGVEPQLLELTLFQLPGTRMRKAIRQPDRLP